jgi:hypothetical protein
VADAGGYRFSVRESTVGLHGQSGQPMRAVGGLFDDWMVRAGFTNPGEL